MGPGGGPLGGSLLSMGLGDGDLLTGSDFALNRESRGRILSFWNRGARSYFSGREGVLSLGGDVRTTMFGTDYADDTRTASPRRRGGYSEPRVAGATTHLKRTDGS